MGKTQDEEIADNLHLLSQLVTGHCVVLFTNEKEKKVLEYFNEFSKVEFAQAGAIAPRDFILKADGEELQSLSWSMEPYLR